MGEYILCSSNGFIYLNSIAVININAQLLYKTIQLHSSPLRTDRTFIKLIVGGSPDWGGAAAAHIQPLSQFCTLALGTFAKGHVVTKDRLDLLDLELEVEKGGNDEVVACRPRSQSNGRVGG